MRRSSEALPMPAGYCAFVLRQLGATAETAAALLEGLEISPEQLAQPDAEITLGQQLRQLRNANRLFAPGWALRIGTAFQPSTHGPLGVAAISAPTLHAGLDVVRRFTHLRNPSHHVRLHRTTGDVRLELEECLALRAEERLPLVETFLLSLQGLVEIILGRPMTAGRFAIGAPEPSYVTLYRAHFHAEVQFATDATAMVIPVDWLTIPSPFADRGMYAAAVSTLERLARRFERAEYAPAEVEHLMAVSGDEILSLAQAARLLGVSQRTLVRRLGAAGTSYRLLRDAHRRRRAEELLREGTLTVAELAFRLGYQDAGNFSRACHRWFGASPGSLGGTRRTR